MDCPACNASGSFGSAKCEVCSGTGFLSDTRIGQPPCRRCSGYGRLGSRVCDVCGGWGLLPDVKPKGQKTLVVTANGPYEAHQEITQIFQSLIGGICVCDPYLGEASLARLAQLAGCASVRFLTRTLDAKQKIQLPQLVREFIKNYPHVDFRIHKKDDLHDRYVLTDAELIILGHGLKDIGNKESFVIRINHDIAEDTINGVRKAFQERWDMATPYP